jgi:hypothetical protein
MAVPQAARLPVLRVMVGLKGKLRKHAALARSGLYTTAMSGFVQILPLSNVPTALWRIHTEDCTLHNRQHSKISKRRSRIR